MRAARLVLLALTSTLILAGCASLPTESASVAPTVNGAVSGTVSTVTSQASETVNNSITWWQQLLIVFLAGIAIPDFKTIFGGIFSMFGSIGSFILKLLGRS